MSTVPTTLASDADHPAESGVVLDLTFAAPPKSESGYLVFFYGRASLDRSGQRSSVSSQEAKFEDLLARNPDWEDGGRYIDSGISASKTGVTRPEFERLMQRLESTTKKPYLIVANDVSRLMRSRRDKIRLEQLIERNIHIHDMRFGHDTRTNLGRIVFGIMAELAIDRADELADYQREYHDRRRKEGRPSKSAIGFGTKPIRNDERHVIAFEIDEEQAESIRFAVRELRAGASLRSVTRDWNDPSHDAHCKPPRAKKWSDASVKKIVCSARIAGCVERAIHDADGQIEGVEFVPNRDGTLPAIVPIADVLALRERFRINGLLVEGGSGVGRTPKYLLSGIAECGSCGDPLYTFCDKRKGQVGTMRYRCKTCGSSQQEKRTTAATMTMQWLDDFVTGAVFERLRSGVIVDLLNATASGEAVEEIARLLTAEQEELRRFDELVDNGGGIGAERYLHFTQAKERRIAELKQALARELEDSPAKVIAALPDDLVERLEEYWDAADLAFKRQLIRLCFERIVLRRAEKPGRMKLEDALKRIELVPRTSLTATQAVETAA